MLSPACHDTECDLLSRIPVVGNGIVRYGSENRTITFSSLNSNVLINSSVISSSPSLCHSCCTLMKLSGCYQLSVFHICHKSFQLAQTHRPHLIQVLGPLNITKLTSDVSRSNYMLSPTSHLPDQCRSIQLFIKSIRNTTISIPIQMDSTASISDLKHLIYAHDGIPPCDLRLLHRGRELRDDALLSGLDVDGATITCLLRVLGGNLYGRIPFYWWFGFSRSYEDGRAGEEGRTCHVLSEIEFGGLAPYNWHSAAPLTDWGGIRFHPGIVHCSY